MANPNFGDIVARAWEETLEETPDPFKSDFLYEMMTGERRTYRERLDVQPRNYRGKLIPRIVTVRRNFRLHFPDIKV